MPAVQEVPKQNFIFSFKDLGLVNIICETGHFLLHDIKTNFCNGLLAKYIDFLSKIANASKMKM